jgi:hypothetical protein
MEIHKLTIFRKLIPCCQKSIIHSKSIRAATLLLHMWQRCSPHKFYRGHVCCSSIPRWTCISECRTLKSGSLTPRTPRTVALGARLEYVHENLQGTYAPPPRRAAPAIRADVQAPPSNPEVSGSKPDRSAPSAGACTMAPSSWSLERLNEARASFKFDRLQVMMSGRASRERCFDNARYADSDGIVAMPNHCRSRLWGRRRSRVGLGYPASPTFCPVVYGLGIIF